MKKHDTNQLPEAVADILVDEILEASDEEIYEMTQEQYGNVESHVDRKKSLIRAAVMNNRKAKLKEAQKIVSEKRRTNDRSNVMDLSPASKRQLIEKVKASNQSLTLAARNAEDISDNDASSLLQDFIDLGVIDEDGNIIE